MPSTPRMALEYASRRQTRPTWQWFAGLAAVGVVALILSQAFTGSETVATPKVISASPAAQPAPAGVLADGQTFWDHVSSRLAEGQGHLAPGEVRRWLSSPAEAGMRLAEARAVIAALEAPDPAETVEDPLAVETEPASEQELGEIEPTAEGEPAELPSEEPVAEVRPAEQPAAAAPEEELAAAPADASWNPASLPAGLRVFERIFGMDDKREAAERLRNYIHAHHRNVDPVFTRLDAYVAQAPKQRTLSVLKQMRYAQPGPKTRRWTRDTVRKLASAAQ